MVSVVLQPGVQDETENEDAAPEGRPETLNETGWIGPDTPMAAIASAADCPCVTI